MSTRLTNDAVKEEIDLFVWDLRKQKCSDSSYRWFRVNRGLQ